MKPLSSCALFGAVRALGGIKDALILQHSVVGCQWGSLAFRYAGKPYDVRQASDLSMMKMLLMVVRRFYVKLYRRQSVFLRIAVRYL